MTNPKYKVGNKVWHIFDQGFVVFEEILVVDSWKGKVFTYLTDTGFVPEKKLFPTAEALLDDIKRQIEEIENGK